MKRSGFFKTLSRLISPSEKHDPNSYWIFVRCNRCGEKISTRVNLSNDLSPDYGEDKDPIYYCRKVLMGQKMCFQQVEVHLKFNQKRELLDREIDGGKFMDDEEFRAGDLSG